MQQVPGTDQWRAYLPQVGLKPPESGHWLLLALLGIAAAEHGLRRT